MSQPSRIFLPKPCPENWEAMNPQAGGRHCDSCQKVVKDFTGMELEEINRVVEAHPPGQVCGRIKAEDVIVPLKGEVWLKLPREKARAFMVALVAVFGMQWWGLSTAEAQAVVQTAAVPPASTVSPDSTVEIAGMVLDKVNYMPMGGVTVTLMQQGTVLAGIVTGAEGRFRLRVKAAKLNGNVFEVHASWLGRTLFVQNLSSDNPEIVVFIDTDDVLPSYELAEVEISTYGRGRVTGQILMGIEVKRMDILNVDGWMTRTEKYYHELDDFIQMRRSDVHYNGRW